MTQPLSNYFISSSHNTYLVGNQLTSISSIGSLSLLLCREFFNSYLPNTHIFEHIFPYIFQPIIQHIFRSFFPHFSFFSLLFSLFSLLSSLFTLHSSLFTLHSSLFSLLSLLSSPFSLFSLLPPKKKIFSNIDMYVRVLRQGVGVWNWTAGMVKMVIHNFSWAYFDVQD